MARLTGLEPATPGVTGRYSNQLSYTRAGAAPEIRASGLVTNASPTGQEPLAQNTSAPCPSDPNRPIFAALLGQTLTCHAGAW